MSNEDDKALFRELYGNIDRVGHDRHELQKHLPKPKPRQRLDVEEKAKIGLNPYPEDQGDNPHDPEGYIYSANGIQKSVMKKLRQGKIPVEAILDLHGMTREQALSALQLYIDDCQRSGRKCLQIVHGKGYRSETGRPVLKPAVASWLRQIGQVLAFCPAMPADGGDGALYVLLKTLR